MANFYMPSVFNELPAVMKMQLITAFSTEAFKELCEGHIKIFTDDLVSLDEDDYEDNAKFRQEYRQLQNKLMFWKGLCELNEEIEQERSNQEEN